MDAACLPADQRRIERALAELALLCKSRPEETEDVAARLSIITARLRDYPGDVALEAIRRWGDSEKWFPSWAELRGRCELLGSKRMMVRTAVAEANRHSQPHRPEPFGARLADIYRAKLKAYGSTDPRTIQAKQELNAYRPEAA